MFSHVCYVVVLVPFVLLEHDVQCSDIPVRVWCEEVDSEKENRGVDWL